MFRELYCNTHTHTRPGLCHDPQVCALWPRIVDFKSYIEVNNHGMLKKCNAVC